MNLKTAYDHYRNDLVERQCSNAHLETIHWRLGRFVDKYAETPVAAITSLNLAAHFRSLRERGLADGTLAGHTRVHKSFWRWCKTNKLIKKNPAKQLKNYSFKPKNRRAAPRGSVERVIAALPAFARHRGANQRDIRDALLVSLSFDCGGRLGEMWSLSRRDVQLSLSQPGRTDAGLVVYRVTGQGKTGESELRFFAHTAELFKLWFEISPRVSATAGVFVNLRTGERLRPGSLGRAFERVCKFAGVPVFRSHAVRKRNISDIIRLAGSTSVGQLYAGHADVETTMTHYDEAAEDEVDEFAAALANRRRLVINDDDDELARLFGIKK